MWGNRAPGGSKMTLGRLASVFFVLRSGFTFWTLLGSSRRGVVVPLASLWPVLKSVGLVLAPFRAYLLLSGIVLVTWILSPFGFVLFQCRFCLVPACACAHPIQFSTVPLLAFSSVRRTVRCAIESAARSFAEDSKRVGSISQCSKHNCTRI